MSFGIAKDIATIVASVDWALLGRASGAPVDHGFTGPQGQQGASPYDVAVLLQGLGDVKGRKVLEIGTGAGGLCAALVRLGAQVTSLDLVAITVAGAQCVQADGFQGWPSNAPYDALVCGASVPSIPEAWFAQVPDGVLLAPVGRGFRQELLRFERTSWGTLRRENLRAVAFSPLQTTT